MDVTGPDVAGSMGELVMVILSSLPVRMLPCCVQEMEVRGRLKPEIEIDKVRSPPDMTSGEAVWPLASLIPGGTKHKKQAIWVMCTTQRGGGVYITSPAHIEQVRGT